MNSNYVVSKDSLIETQVIEGLKAAKLRELAKVRPPIHVQEVMMADAFPALSEGDEKAKQLSDSEYSSLRESMQTFAIDNAADTISTLKVQLSEYYEVLEQMNTLKRQCERLHKQNTSLRSTIKQEFSKKDTQIAVLQRDNEELKRRSNPEWFTCAMFLKMECERRDETIGLLRSRLDDTSSCQKIQQHPSSVSQQQQWTGVPQDQGSTTNNSQQEQASGNDTLRDYFMRKVSDSSIGQEYFLSPAAQPIQQQQQFTMQMTGMANFTQREFYLESLRTDMNGFASSASAPRVTKRANSCDAIVTMDTADLRTKRRKSECAAVVHCQELLAKFREAD
eukprot:g7289.t1 g7289   contig24:289238-290340(-)